MYGMNFFTQSKLPNSLKFANEEVISFHTLLGMYFVVYRVEYNN